MEIKIYQGSSIQEGCKLALSNRLFVPGWALRDELKQKVRIAKIAIVFEESRPVAIAVLFNNFSIQAFCRKTERRKGFASSAVKRLEPYSTFCNAECGGEGSLEFWKKNGIGAY